MNTKHWLRGEMPIMIDQRLLRVGKATVQIEEVENKKTKPTRNMNAVISGHSSFEMLFEQTLNPKSTTFVAKGKLEWEPT